MSDSNTLFQPPGFERRNVATTAGEINYYEAMPQGRDAIGTLVFLHTFGGGSSSFEWSRVYPSFSAEYRVLAPDLPGWGYSEHQPIEYTAGFYRTAIREFIQNTGAECPTIIAASLVAALYVWEATEQPELGEHLVLVNPSGLSDFGRPYNGSLFGWVDSIALLNQFLYDQGIQNRTTIRGYLERVLFANPRRISEEMVDAYYESARQPNARYAAFSFLKGNLSFDLAAYLPKLSVPTAFLWGEKNNYASPETGRRLAALTPAVRYFAVIPDTGITPQLELPAVTASAIRRAMFALAATPSGSGAV